MRRRLAALVIAALLAISAAALATAVLAADAQDFPNTGDFLSVRGANDNDQQYGGRGY